MRKLRPYQAKGFTDIFRAWDHSQIVMFVLSTGGGKCLGKDTPVLMFDGSMKMVQDIKPDEQLMGIDSTPRNVLSVCTGSEPMYKIVPRNGEPFICNESHILSLKSNTSKYGLVKDQVFNISIRDYFNLSKSQKHVLKLYRSDGFDFPEQPVDIDPYLLGIWLGDGNSNTPGLTSMDKPVIDYWLNYAKESGHNVRIDNNKGSKAKIYFLTNGYQRTGLLNLLRKNNLYKNKHIPEKYLHNSRKIRMTLLAALLDTDGYYSKCGYEIFSCHPQLAKDIVYLSRSLGFYTSITYKEKVNGWRININGEGLEELPMLVEYKRAKKRTINKNCHYTGFSIESLGIGDYYGFEIDGDHLFMINDDFTVTHNTFTFTEVMRYFYESGRRCMLIAHREELITQAWNTLNEAGMTAGIIKAEYPNRYEMPIQVCSIQTLARRKDLPPADLIVIDEGHHVTEDNTYGRIIAQYPDAKVLIVTATPYRLSGEGFTQIIPGKQTELIINLTLKQSIDEGWLVPLKYCVGSIPDMSGVHIVRGDYNEDEAKKVMELAPLVDSYNRLAKGKCGICYCVNVAHSIEVAEQYNRAGIAAVHVDANTPDEIRRGYWSMFRKGEIKVVCNVGILTEGTDFPNAEFIQLARPTKSLSMYLQMVGRVSRALPGIVDLYDTSVNRRAAIAASSKPYGIVLDNAGSWLEHGFPDDNINWEYYFKGWKKKATNVNMIEIPVYEIENPVTGVTLKTKKIKELEGMILVAITYEQRAKLQNAIDIAEFEKLYRVAASNKHIEKKGFFVYYRMKDFCLRKQIDMRPELWQHMKKRLVEDIDIEVNRYIEEQKRRGIYVIPSHDKKIKEINNRGVKSGFLEGERIQWMKQTHQQSTTQ